jgi:hypothetical protein
MGTRYAKIVETCFTCLDEVNVDFGDVREFQDADDILEGVRYIEKVLCIRLDKMFRLISSRFYYSFVLYLFNLLFNIIPNRVLPIVSF